ncbi:MAG: rRNA maturation RNase YbeY [Candidatus Gastranaerophilales bacterium]|nr:rRNA maturation RNase YbeY [Candidatus Gastranaerophilales bacterium]
MTQLNIFIENIYEKYEIDEAKVLVNLKRIVEYILANNEVFDNSCLANYVFNSLSFDVVLCDNDKIHEVNRDYRNKDRATDVITFAMFADSDEDERFILDGDISLGEIIVSIDKTEEQSKDHNQTFDDELYFLLAHGVLHLLGFDHQTEDEYNFMMNTQELAKAVLNV